MEHKVLTLRQISVCYYQTELTRSHSQNFSIIRQHWKAFNTLLKINKVTLGANWEKLAMTQRYKDQYYYQCAFPSAIHIRPFEFMVIPAGNYFKFDHKGSMSTIGKTLNEIYNNVIPKSHIQIDKNRSMIHFERYDSKFNWNSQDSVVEVYIPLPN